MSVPAEEAMIVGKLWALLFGVTMLACLGLFLVAPLVPHWWLSERIATHDWDIDFLFYVILYITGFFFVLTEGLLVAFMFRYATEGGKPAQPGPSVVAQMLKPVTSILNEPHKIELAWTLVPAAILLYIAFAQVSTWADVKYNSRFPDFVVKSGKKVAVVAEVSARQFEWRMRYPSHKRMTAFLSGKDLDGDDKKDYDTFGKYPQIDDVHVVNELHAIKNHPSLVHLSTRDVIHSFNLNPHLHIKQDALPGKVLPVWFIATKSNTKFGGQKSERWVDEPIWDIACAELCGWGHFRMVGRLHVHETQEDFLDWLKHAEAEQNRRSPKSAGEK
jgi:cytochrome c oxidase subunit II